jgi:hypothetical protein
MTPTLQKSTIRPHREPIPWIEWARQCGYRPESFAELFAVPREQFNECFECIHCRTLSHWLFEARLWEAGRRTLCQNAWAWPAGKSPREPGRRLLANLLHPRIRTGDSSAPEALFNLLNDSVMESLSWKFPRIDDSILWDGWTGAFLNDLQRFDSNRGDLEKFLKLAAFRNVLDSLSGLKQRQRFERSWEDAFLSGAKADQLCSDEFISPKTPAELLAERERLAELEEQIEQFRATLTTEESIIFNLHLQGERRTEVFAEALGIVRLLSPEQLRKIRIIKDRIRKARERFHWWIPRK